LIGAGEVFAISASFETAYVIAPPEQKGLASSINLFFVGAVPNVLSILVYNACKDWFPVGDAKTPGAVLQDYAESKLYNYFWLMTGLVFLAVIINVLPPVTRWVERLEQTALDVKLSATPLSSVSLEASDCSTLPESLYAYASSAAFTSSLYNGSTFAPGSSRRLSDYSSMFIL
jgi:hypothetical protein